MLRRLGTTPLGRSGLLIAKAISTLLVVVLQVVAVVAVGIGLGWKPGSSLGIAAGIIALGAAAFAGLGLLLAGRLRAELNLAVANALFLVFLLLGGIVVPMSKLPEGVRSVAGILPAEPLASALRTTLAGGHPLAGDLVTLGAWALFSGLLAALTFRWD
jgi:ABC-2 type transport system permease protein